MGYANRLRRVEACRGRSGHGPGLVVFLLTLAAALGLGAPCEAGIHPLSRGTTPALTLREPYRPGAYPVVLIHGMTSSNRTWEPMIERIQADPVLANQFQFWKFSYDQCAALPISAAALRTALIQARWALDPSGTDPALDRMVLIGQSQGGLLAKTAAQDSGWALWDATFTRRPEALDCSPTTRAEIIDAFVTRRVPSVGRLIFVATPHHGARAPAVPAARLKNMVITDRRRRELAGPIDEVIELNGRDVLVPTLRRVPVNAIGELGWDSPYLDALQRIPVAPDVPAHSIIPQLGTWRHHLNTDGVIIYGSTHQEWVDSEVIVPGPHIALNRPEVAAEVGRILRIHLAEEGIAPRPPGWTP